MRSRGVSSRGEKGSGGKWASQAAATSVWDCVCGGGMCARYHVTSLRYYGTIAIATGSLQAKSTS